jgi:HAD superfamily hydrolase (TIGR01490 family)
MIKVCAFDFDGTLTTRDTLIEFIRYAKGSAALCFGFLLHCPLLVLMKLGLYPNYKAKQRIFSFYFRGMDIKDFDEVCRRFAADKRNLLRRSGIAEMQRVQNAGAKILVVSASIDNWVMPFFHDMKDVVVAGTKIETIDGRLTGRFLTKNCYGQEKVNRIKAMFPDRGQYELTAYGDSRGDKEMLEYADQGYYKPFK